MLILSIDTSCDETAAAVTEGTKILSNIIWSQASLHAKWGGVYPSLAQRAHEEHIDWTVEKAMLNAKTQMLNISAVAVTQGPGLAIALEVGVKKAQEISRKYNLPLIPINHVEGHLLSPLADSNSKIKNQKSKPERIKFPALGIVISGKHTDIVLIEEIGKYKILAQTIDDALGEALDKAARMLGLGYPGGAVLEKMAKDDNKNKYPLPIPLLGQAGRMEFSFSGLKTAMYRLTENKKPLTKEKIQNLAAAFQDKAFLHFENVFKKAIEQHPVSDVLFGGGVSSNIEIRKRLRKICGEKKASLHLPYSKKLCTDNAAMIGIAAFYKFKRKEFLQGKEIEKLDRSPRMAI